MSGFEKFPGCGAAAIVALAIDGANAALDFVRSRGISQADI
jgi:hypothetical protein